MSSSDPPSELSRRWRLDLAYDGTGFRGFAEQPGHETVVGTLRAALARTLRLSEAPLLYGAGRTDAGVHAVAQVVHVDLAEPLFIDDRGPAVERLRRSLNRQLGGRIVVLQLRPVANDFHARHSASWRAYRYLVLDDDDPPLAISARFAWSVPGPLDIDTMNEAATLAVGTHDFRSFCRRPAGSSAEEPLWREVLSAHWHRVPDTWGLTPKVTSVLRFDIKANAFCHQMVRSITAVCVAVGRGQLAPSTVSERLLSPKRLSLPAPAPAHGLSLVGVGYAQLAGGPSGFVS